MRENEFGEIVRNEWLEAAEIRPNVELDAFVVMPNHVRGILVITADDSASAPGATQRVAPTNGGGPVSGSVGAIVGQIKSQATKRINRLRDTPGAPVWQRNYYEHIIRDERGLDRLRSYIEGNPGTWYEDRLYISIGSGKP